MFENAEISADDLPKAEAVDWQSMDPEFLKRQVVGSLLGVLFTALIMGFIYIVLTFAFREAEVDVSIGWLWLVLLVVAAPLIVWPFLSVPRKGYAVRERDIIYKSGVIWRSITAVPFNRIQHVEKSSTPLDRRYQLATLELFTAGGSGGDLKIHGLPARTAEKLRVFILDKIGSTIEQG